MHIPDGYLSPQTTTTAIAVMVPFWGAALSKAKKVLKSRQIPMLALCSAFSFVIMMFNVPLGQSSVHAVGAVFAAIVLGPWQALLAVSVALTIQAFVFGDGGILALGANCFNMAVAMPFVGYSIYNLIAGKSDILSRRSMVGSFLGGYVGLNAAALLTAVEFGIQPLLFKAADGTPLYGFYPLSVSVPAMMFEHLLFAGPIEGIITAAALGYVAKYAPHVLGSLNLENPPKAAAAFRAYRPLIYAVAVMVLLTPIGLFATYPAWGEWGLDEIAAKIGYIPEGLEKLSQLSLALLPDYSVPALRGGFFKSSLGYAVSALVGILLVTAVTVLISKIAVREQKVKDGKQ